MSILQTGGGVINMNCCGGLRRTRVPNGNPIRALLLGLPLVVVLAYLPGCGPGAGGADETVNIDLAPGRTASGELLGGQGLRTTTAVEAGHIYEIRASLTEVSVAVTGITETEGSVSGAPLAEPVEFLIATSSGGGLDAVPAVATFLAVADGEVVIAFSYDPDSGTGSGDALLEALRGLIRGDLRADYRLLLTDVGFDDNGTSPDDAVTLEVGAEGELTGTIHPGDEADFFILPLLAETTYQLTLESTDSANVTSGAEDRFGQINFGIATPGGLIIEASATAGSPSITEFTAPATEEVLLRLTGTSTGGTGLGSSADATIYYAISVVETVPEAEEPDEGF